jgi:hypothetical protein
MPTGMTLPFSIVFCLLACWTHGDSGQMADQARERLDQVTLTGMNAKMEALGDARPLRFLLQANFGKLKPI